MSQHCTRCEGSGFLNVDQIGDVFQSLVDTADNAHEVVRLWAVGDLSLQPDPPAGLRELVAIDPASTDVQVCDCCGDGDRWHGDEPGRHDYEQKGQRGPYAANGGMWRCA